METEISRKVTFCCLTLSYRSFGEPFFLSEDRCSKFPSFSYVVPLFLDLLARMSVGAQERPLCHCVLFSSSTHADCRYIYVVLRT